MACLITGCALINGHAAAWGDLHDLGDVFIFNAVLKDLEPYWQSAEPFVAGKYLDITHADYFERRGVFVIPKHTAQLNQVAIDYIEAGKRLFL